MTAPKAGRAVGHKEVDVIQRIATVVLALAFVGPAEASTAGVQSLVDAELGLRDAVSSGDRAALARLYADRRVPGAVRGRALWALYADGASTLTAEERAPLVQALADPAAEVRRAALRAVGRRGDRPLEREALSRLAEDPDPGVRVEALRAVRPWSRQGHLYFLDRALGAGWPEVQAEALANLGRIALRELPPEVVARVRHLTGPDAAPRVRAGAIRALKAWGRLEWDLVRGTVVDRSAPEALRVLALEASEGLTDGEERRALLLDLVAGDPSQLVVWDAYRRLRSTHPGAADLPSAVARYLCECPQRNAATEQMAAFLRDRGYRIEYLAGGWEVRR